MYAKFVFAMGLFLANSLVFGTEDGAGDYFASARVSAVARMNAPIKELRGLWSQISNKEFLSVSFDSSELDRVWFLASRIDGLMRQSEGEIGDAKRKNEKKREFVRLYWSCKDNVKLSRNVGASIGQMLKCAQEFYTTFS
jgi:hypothetical protein